MVVLLQIIPSFPDSQPQIGVEEFLSLPQFIHALLMQIQINPVSMRIHFNFFDQLSWVNQWIGLRENLQETMCFYHQIYIGLSCKFSHHPILWVKQ